MRAAARARSALPLEAHRHVLANGLELVVQEDHHAPFVAVNVVYRVGGRDDPPGKGGLAHLFEHLTFDGTKHAVKGQFDVLLGKAGAYNVNAETSDDATQYYETVPAKHLELALWLESERMGFFVETLNAAVLDKERAIVKSELHQRYDNVAYGYVHGLVRAALFPETHPYHRMPIGDDASLEAITLADAKGFYDRYYAPDNATIVIVGDVDETTALALTKQYFDPIAKNPTPLARWPHMPVTVDKEKTITIEADVDAPRIVLAWPMPTEGDADYWSSVVAAQFATGNLSGELTTSDSENETNSTKIAHTVTRHYESSELAGALYVDITLHPGKDVQKARAAIDDAINAMGRYSGYEVNSVKRAGTTNVARIIFQLEQLGGRAETFGHDNAFFGDPLHVKSDLGALDGLDADEVHDAFKDHILRANPVVAVVIPKSGAPKGGRLVANP